MPIAYFNGICNEVSFWSQTCTPTKLGKVNSWTTVMNNCRWKNNECSPDNSTLYNAQAPPFTWAGTPSPTPYLCGYPPYLRPPPPLACAATPFPDPFLSGYPTYMSGYSPPLPVRVPPLPVRVPPLPERVAHDLGDLFPVPLLEARIAQSEHQGKVFSELLDALPNLRSDVTRLKVILSLSLKLFWQGR